MTTLVKTRLNRFALGGVLVSGVALSLLLMMRCELINDPKCQFLGLGVVALGMVVLMLRQRLV